jgi:epoxyqueuosine reductase
MPNPGLTSEQIEELALETGFDLVGVIPLAPPRAAPLFERWLDAGHHGEMAWLARDRERILDPRKIFPKGRSLLVVGFGHARAAVTLEGGGRVARYAAGRDYHNIGQRLLKKLIRRLRQAGVEGRMRPIIDAGPLLERSHAAEAGIGFESRSANLIHPEFGPWFFLGEILLEEELEPTEGSITASCGNCTACLDACPTGALREPGVVDSRLCISYLTIEHRGPIPHHLRPAIGDRVFGCDVCAEVCPWGRRAEDRSSRFGTHAAIEGKRLADWLGTPEADFAEIFRGSPLRRSRRDGLARNAAIALGNRPGDRGEEALREALASDPSPLVREAAAWGLLRGHDSERSRADLERALATEPDEDARAGMGESLEGGIA